MTKLLKDNHQNGSTNNGASVDAVHILRPFVEFLFYVWICVCVCSANFACVFVVCSFVWCGKGHIDPKLWFLFINVWPNVVQCTTHTHTQCNNRDKKRPLPNTNPTHNKLIRRNSHWVFFIIVPAASVHFRIVILARRLAMFGVLYIFLYTFAWYISI